MPKEAIAGLCISGYGSGTAAGTMPGILASVQRRRWMSADFGNLLPAGDIKLSTGSYALVRKHMEE